MNMKICIELLLVAAVIGSGSCFVLKCKFKENVVWRDYCCEVTEWSSPTNNGRISVIEGKHMEGKNIDDVECLWIENLHSFMYFSNDFFMKFQYLRNLLIQSTSLKHLLRGDFIFAKHMMNVYIRNNPITHLEDYCFYGATIESTLNLKSNQIRKIAEDAFAGLTSLKFLILSSNQIEALHSSTFSDLSLLKELSLADNKIRHIDERLFSRNRHLEVLFLGNNRLKVINGDIFQHNWRMTSIYMDNNEIERIQKLENFLVNLEHLEMFIFTNNTCESVQIHVYRRLYPSYDRILANCAVN